MEIHDMDIISIPEIRSTKQWQWNQRDEAQGCREAGVHSGESACLPPMCPGFKSWNHCHMWVEFVVGSRPCSEGFSPGSPVFLPSQKSTCLNSNLIGNLWASGSSVVDCYMYVLPSLNKVYYYYYMCTIKTVNCGALKRVILNSSTKSFLKFAWHFVQGRNSSNFLLQVFDFIKLSIEVKEHLRF